MRSSTAANAKGATTERGTRSAIACHPIRPTTIPRGIPATRPNTAMAVP